MDPLFNTADYGVAGYLFARGFKIERTQRSGSQVVFCFPDTPELVAAVGDYTSNLPFPCRDLFHGLRKAKSIIQEIIHDHQPYPRR